MIGIVLGLVASCGLIASGWNPRATDTPAIFLVFAGALLVGGVVLGVLLMPRTVGFACMSIQFGGVIAAVAALSQGNGSFVLPMLAVGVAAFLCQLIVGNIRRDAT